MEGIAATSSIIQRSLQEDYVYTGLIPFLPPCVDPERFHPRDVVKDDEVWEFLSELSGLPPAEIRGSKIITEISRTDRTKRKDVLIRAFARTQSVFPKSFLIVSIDESHPELAAELHSLLDELGVAGRTAAIGSVWEILPTLYAITDVYCTPSVMEGFGMAAQEAAATGVPVVASHLVPFAAEYLLGDAGQHDRPGGPTEINFGEGTIVVPAEDVDGFTEALTTLLKDDGMRMAMGARALEITIPEFTWQSRTRAFLEAIEGLV
jgi:glycosyltransferase involved in cell wall biosynthesis